MDQELEILLITKPTLANFFLMKLPENSKCCSCRGDLSGQLAQKLMNSKNLSTFWRPSDMALLLAYQRYPDLSEEDAWTSVYKIWNMFSRYSHLPIVYDSFEEPTIISCNDRKCSGMSLNYIRVHS